MEDEFDEAFYVGMARDFVRDLEMTPVEWCETWARASMAAMGDLGDGAWGRAVRGFCAWAGRPLENRDAT